MMISLTYNPQTQTTTFEYRCAETDRLMLALSCHGAPGVEPLTVEYHGEPCDCCPDLTKSHANRYWELTTWRYLNFRLTGVESALSFEEIAANLESLSEPVTAELCLLTLEELGRCLPTDANLDPATDAAAMGHLVEQPVTTIRRDALSA